MGAVAFARSAPSFAERIRTLIDTVDYRLAVTDAEKEAIYRLRYNGYLWEKAILPNFGRRLSDKFDDLDSSWIFGVFIGGELASSIRITVATAAHPLSPGVETFPDALARELAGDKVLVDPTRFVVDREMSRRYPDLRYATTRIAVMAAEHFGADLLLASVRTEHQPFYHRTFGHEVVREAREYPTLIKPLSLMASDFPRQRDAMMVRYPFFRSTYFERRMMFESSRNVRWEETPATLEPMVPALAS
jgi:N-acyl-L-homoserine lactone synthetase